MTKDNPYKQHGEEADRKCRELAEHKLRALEAKRAAKALRDAEKATNLARQAMDDATRAEMKARAEAAAKAQFEGSLDRDRREAAERAARPAHDLSYRPVPVRVVEDPSPALLSQQEPSFD